MSYDRANRLKALDALRGKLPAIFLVVLAGASGCAFAPQASVPLPAPAAPQAELWEGFALLSALGLGPVWNRYMVPYITGRLRDALDIFEVGVGFGRGLGVQASVGVGFVGLVRGRYNWFGVFGADQIGATGDNQFVTVGFPLSLINSVLVLTRRHQWSWPARFLASVYFLLGQEDGIGGPRKSGGGYSTFGFVGFSRHDWPTSASGPVGAAVAVGPVAAVARIRLGAVVNFVTGFVGVHLFKQPYR